MIKIEALTPNDFQKYSIIIQNIYQNYDVEIGYLYKYITDTTEGVIYLNTDRLISFYYYDNDNNLKNTCGYFDENYIFNVFYHNNKSFLKTNNIWIMTDENSIEHSINLFPLHDPIITNNIKYNGQVAYIQYNPLHNILVTLYYNHFYQDENSKISEFALHNPWKIVITKTGIIKHEKNYILKEVNCYENSLEYNILQKQKYESNNPQTISRYYRIFFPFNGDVAINLFPLTKPLDFNEIREKLTKLSLNLNIDSDLLNIYNKNYDLIVEYQKILFKLKEIIEKNENIGIKLVLEKDLN